MRFNIDDPDIFKGYTEVKGDQNLVIEENYGYGFTDFKGDVEVIYEDGDSDGPEAFYLLGDGKDLKLIPPGATITTGRNSYVVVNFGDSANFILGPNSQLKIKKPEYGFFDTTKGQVLMNIKKNLTQMITEGSLDVTMNQAVAGRKGTTAVFIEEDGISTVKVLEGEISFKSIATGETVDILPGETVSASKNGLTELTKFSVEDELDQWEEVVPANAITKVREYIAQEAAAVNLNDSSESSGSSKLIYVGVIAAVILLLGFIVIKKKKGTEMKK